MIKQFFAEACRAEDGLSFICPFCHLPHTCDAEGKAGEVIYVRSKCAHRRASDRTGRGHLLALRIAP